MAANKDTQWKQFKDNSNYEEFMTSSMSICVALCVAHWEIQLSVMRLAGLVLQPPCGPKGGSGSMLAQSPGIGIP